jgi:murein DD-endopeptidase MepM/ murein hydrolase activator NlpD
MSKSTASNISRFATRMALTGIVGVWLAGCSSDATRLSDPFTNPFASASNDDAAPTPKVAVSPLASNAPANGAYSTPAHRSPIAVSALSPAPATTGTIKPTTTQPITGFGGGWSVAGGSPIVVADGDTVDSLSQRYGVPPSALLKANGFESASQVHAGSRLTVPVYDASGAKSSHVADTEDSPKAKRGHKADDEDSSKAKHKHDAADSDDSPKAKSNKSIVADDDSKSGHGHRNAKDAAADAAQDSAIDAKSGDRSRHAALETKSAAPTSLVVPKGAKTADAANPKPSPQVATKGAPVNLGKKPASTDMTPTANIHPEETASATSAPLTGQQADAAGVSPEFRWPARGRIIQGFKSGGNDGINIAVPEGTSVKAAESGVVAYAGSELKGYGNLVLIRHPNGYVTAYANNGELDVKRGETVKRGQIIAKSGQSGNVSSPQLHFELRKGSTPVDPTNFLAGL